jgi:phosphate transporter
MLANMYSCYYDLHVRHFLTRGIPASLMSWAVIVTIGYGLMYIAGL